MSSERRSAANWQANQIIIDILERSKLQDDLILENIRGVSAVIDETGAIYKANHELAQIFSVPLCQIREHSLASLFQKESWATLLKQIQSFQSNEKHSSFEMVTDGLDEDQQKVYLFELYHYGKYKNSDSDFYFILGTDITKQRKTEVQLKDQFEENKKLIRIITHDLAGPLTVIEYVGRQLTKEKADLPALQMRLLRSFRTIKEILTSVHNLQAIIDGVKKMNLANFPIDQIITETLLLFEERFREKQIKIEFEPSHLNVYVDGNTLRNQILANLISNAIKFTFKGKTIKITVQEMQDLVVITVSDQGTGIKADSIPNLFVVSKNTSTQGTSGEKGTGYGLPICKSILDLMGGDITVESKHIDESPDDHGTTFYVYVQKERKVLAA